MRAAIRVPRLRTEAWFERQLSYARACLEEADRTHTPEELAAAHAALATLPGERQRPLSLGVLNVV